MSLRSHCALAAVGAQAGGPNGEKRGRDLRSRARSFRLPLETRKNAMKTIVLVLCLSVSTLFLAGCHTAHSAAEGAVDEADHAVDKTSHAVHHGVRKVERHL